MKKIEVSLIKRLMGFSWDPFDRVLVELSSILSLSYSWTLGDLLEESGILWIWRKKAKEK